MSSPPILHFPEELLERFLPAIQQINPEFDREWVIKTWVHKAEYAQPVPLLNHSQNIPAIQTPIVDETGAGDALTAGIIFGLLEGIPIDECVRLGVTAASLTLRSNETVRADLSVDLLYDDLVV